MVRVDQTKPIPGTHPDNCTISEISGLCGAEGGRRRGLKSIIARVRTTTSSPLLMRCENPQGELKLRTMTKTRQRKRRDQSRRRRRFHHHQPEIHLPSLLVSFHLSFLPDQNGIFVEAFACGRHGRHGVSKMFG